MIGDDELRDLARCSSVVGSWLLAEARELSDVGRVLEANARVEAARLAYGVGAQAVARSELRTERERIAASLHPCDQHA